MAIDNKFNSHIDKFGMYDSEFFRNLATRMDNEGIEGLEFDVEEVTDRHECQMLRLNVIAHTKK